jgi:hypothetical protein
VKTTSWGRRATSSALALLATFAASGCGGARSASAPQEKTGVSLDVRAPVDFAFDSLDNRAVTGEATRGKPTVIAFVDTGSLAAQAQVDFLVAMAKRDAERVNYAVVALEAPTNRELVELYRKSLAIPFPVALADASTLAGGGPFGDVTAVPVTVVLDRAGRVTWHAAGRVARADEVRAALRAVP